MVSDYIFNICIMVEKVTYCDTSPYLNNISIL